ncbi:hypothetical protein CAMSH0001_1030 [Campylobacter showae RM3277]|uniref:Uncharacterized protein n=1 Tax=Campylobacter showae RM3277 TaxID=553219 RepID=C6RHS6_9BACT|nr:hypothetical protein CAMSH0001_1030 [Campylobacter showae RM3277]
MERLAFFTLCGRTLFARSAKFSLDGFASLPFVIASKVRSAAKFT